MPARSPRPLPSPPLWRPSAEQMARELARAEVMATAERAWRRGVRRTIGLAFLSLLVANLIGVSAWLVDDERLGRVLLAAGQAALVLFPFLIGITWVFAAHQRGDL